MSTLVAEFTVVGVPVPQGSARAFAGKGKAAGRAFLTNDPTGSIGKWRADIRSAYSPLGLPLVREPIAGPASMRLTFRFPRPKSHYLPANSKRTVPELRPDAPTYHTTPPDEDKLIRACADALTGVLYVDDAQVVVIGAVKRYANPGEQPGVDVRVTALEGDSR